VFFVLFAGSAPFVKDRAVRVLPYIKSAQATYQWSVQSCLHKQIRRNVHAYVDDIVVKSRKKETLIDDLKEMFDNLRVYKMMLNPAKCVWCTSRQALGISGF